MKDSSTDQLDEILEDYLNNTMNHSDFVGEMRATEVANSEEEFEQWKKKGYEDGLKQAKAKLIQWKNQEVRKAGIEGRIFAFSQVLHYKNVPDEVKEKLIRRISALRGTTE